MKKTMMALALCLMSAISFAGNRQVSTTLPAETPSVTLTLDGKQRVVQLTKAAIKEADASHVRCTVYAGKDKAEVLLPISYNTMLELGYKTAEIAHNLNLINAQEWHDICREYQRQKDLTDQTN